SITFQSSNTFSSLGIGIYQIYVVDNNGCSISDSLTMDNAVGGEQPNTLKISVYPNPLKTFINIEGIQKETIFSLFDLFGKEVLTKKLLTGKNRIEIKNFTSGIYIYSIAGEQKVGKL